MVLRFEAELGIITYPSYHSRLIAESFRAGQIAAVIDAGHRLAKKRRLRPDELSTAPFVLKTGGRTETLLKQKKLNLNVVMKCESGEAVKAAVESGLGIGLIYREYVERELRRGYLKAIELPWLKDIEFKWFIIHRKGEQLSRYAEYFVRLLRQSPSWSS
jgi:DNA-binding transcriptional LysR family regulator